MFNQKAFEKIEFKKFTIYLIFCTIFIASCRETPRSLVATILPATEKNGQNYNENLDSASALESKGKATDITNHDTEEKTREVVTNSKRRGKRKRVRKKTLAASAANVLENKEKNDKATAETPEKEGSTAQTEGGKISLNQATESELVKLPGVGPATAKKIITYRERRKFRRSTDLMRIRGIGKKRYKKIAPLVVID